MKLKRTIAFALTLLMLLPCVLTAAVALEEEGDWLVHESLINENGYVCTKETMKASYGARTVANRTFDKQGHLLKEVEKTRDADGSSYTRTKTCSYNKAGDQVTEAYSFRASDGDFERYVAVYTYDKKGRLTKETFSVQNTEGTDFSARTLTYDAKGNKTKAVIEQRQADGITSRDVYTYAYDKQNRVVKVSFQSASSSDYVRNETVRYTYQNGRPVKETSVETSGVVGNMMTTKKSIVRTFDKKGNEIKTVERETNDYYAQTKKTERTFNRQKHLLTETYISKDSYGTVLKSKEVNTYDANGFLTKHVKTEKDSDGRNDKSTETCVNDKKGNPTKKTTVEMNYGETTKTVETITYDKKGREATHKTAVRTADGALIKYAETYTYDKAGNVVKSVVTTKEADGVGRQVYTSTYQKVAKK